MVFILIATFLIFIIRSELWAICSSIN